MANKITPEYVAPHTITSFPPSEHDDVTMVRSHTETDEAFVERMMRLKRSSITFEAMVKNWEGMHKTNPNSNGQLFGVYDYSLILPLSQETNDDN